MYSVDNGVEIAAVGGEWIFDVEDNTRHFTGENLAVRILRLDGSGHATPAVKVDHGRQIRYHMARRFVDAYFHMIRPRGLVDFWTYRGELLPRWVPRYVQAYRLRDLPL